MKTINDEVSESTVTLLEENSQLLAEHATRLCASIGQALADRKAIEAANTNDAEILAGKQREIDRLDAEVDPNNLDALQNLAARRDQLARLTTKYSDEAKERLATADANFAALDLTGELTALLQEARLVAVEQLATVLRPYFSNDALVLQFLLRTETMNQLARFQVFTPSHVSTVTEIENAVRDLIQPIAEGCPPWMFRRETMA
jgi:hypothetical protein